MRKRGPLSETPFPSAKKPLLIVSVNRLIYIKSLNDFRDFFYS